MLINLKKFNNKEIFDKNFFLYFEEFDLCKSVINKGEFVYTSKDLKVNHLGFKSSLGKNLVEKNNAINVKDWHWMWSSFYYHKKHYGYMSGLIKIFPKLLSSTIKFVIYLLIFKKFKSDVYKYRVLGIINSVLLKKSWYRPKI